MSESAIPPIAPDFVINAQYLKDLSFEHPNSPRSLIQSVQPVIDLKVNVTSRPVGEVQEQDGLASGVFEVQLALRAIAATADADTSNGLKQEDTVFIVDMVYAALVTCQNVPQTDVRPLLLIEAPRMIFPYARSIVLTITAEGGFPPLMINPIDFGMFYQQNYGSELA